MFQPSTSPITEEGTENSIDQLVRLKSNISVSTSAVVTLDIDPDDTSSSCSSFQTLSYDENYPMRDNALRSFITKCATFMPYKSPTYDELMIEMATPSNLFPTAENDPNISKATTEVQLIDEAKVITETVLLTTPEALDDEKTELEKKLDVYRRQELLAQQMDENRETWERSTDFLLSIIGFAVDLANVWRFPYLCYRNGGGAFLIPYTLMLIFGAVPLFYMELILGQSNRQGPISVWQICPLFKGIGFCAVMVAFYVSFYYNVIIGWAVYFLFASATPDLPWVHCNNSWNTAVCSDSLSNNSLNASGTEMKMTSILPHSPASEYFHRAVLEMQWSGGLHEIGYPKWQLVLCLLIVYCMLYLSLFKGVKSTGLVVWATATLPYAVLTILLIRGLMLPGAFSGIVYYLNPELSRLQDTQVWVDAAVQVFYSVGAGFGVHLSYASYNDYNNNCYRDCLITTAVNCFTSFFSGFVIFTYLGYMSVKQGIPISSVATEGPGLVFQVYPEAVATLPGSHLWSVLFFFMLIMLGIDSAMGGLECVITGIMDEFALYFSKKKHAREWFTLCVVFLSFTVAMINVTPGGIYMFHLFDTYSAGISLLCSALFEAIAVSWFYGVDRLMGDVELMMGQQPGLYWRICWKFISPLFIIGVVLFGLLYHEPLQYHDYKYPEWAERIGWCLALSSVLMIPIWAVVQMLRTPGTWKERLALNITPIEEHKHMLQSNRVLRFERRHWLNI